MPLTFTRGTDGTPTFTYTAPQTTATFTYTNEGVTDMPVPTYTSEQIRAMELKRDNATTEMTRSYYGIMLNHMTRPHIWSIAEALGHAKYIIKNNLSKNERYSRLSAQASYGYETIMTRRRELYSFGVEAREAFRNHDHSRLVEMLNDNDTIRNMTGSSNWCDILNDPDKFPDAPNYEYCSDCDYIEDEEDGSWVYNGDRWVCSSCRGNNYRWSDYHDAVVADDEEEPYDEEDDDNDNDSSLIGGYHSSRRKLGLIPTKFTQRATPVYMGLELEMEIDDDESRHDKAEELLTSIGTHKSDISGNQSTYNYCLLEEDGSLSNGFEMVTGYTGLDVHAKQLEFFKRIWSGVRSHDTKTCGLHVHICKKGMTMFHAAKLILFMHDSRNQRLFRAIARRDANRYSQVKNKTADYSWLKYGRRNGMQRLNEDRYESVNFQPEKTVEFRLFKGSLRYETIMACLEFTYATWFFTRDTGQQDLTADNFLKYISQPSQRKDTAHLRSFLRSKGFSLDKAAIVKVNPRIEKQAEQQTAEV